MKKRDGAVLLALAAFCAGETLTRFPGFHSDERSMCGPAGASQAGPAGTTSVLLAPPCASCVLAALSLQHAPAVSKPPARGTPVIVARQIRAALPRRFAIRTSGRAPPVLESF